MTDVELEPGQLVGGDFEIVRPLATGGMGTVYVARQQSTGSLRALKIMRSRFARDPDFVERFTREAKASARVRSRHVVEVVQANVDRALGIPWIALEFLEGQTLALALSTFGVPTAADARVLLEQLWHALSAAHDAGLVHRDLKPENLFLARADSPGTPFTLKVLDFGIAQWLADTEGASPAGLLTPLWGAPEQSVAGAAVGPYTDVWSLGLIVFWLYTGKPFFAAESTPVALERAVHHEPLPLASARAVELGCRRPLSAAFDAWFARAVARDPRRRFAHAREAAKALEAVPLAWPAKGLPWRFEATPSDPAPVPALARTVKPPAWRATHTAALFGAGAALALGAVLWNALRGASGPRAISRPSAASVALPKDMRAIAPVPPGLQAFAMDAVEVSVERYRACVASGACTESAFHSDGAGPAVASSFDDLCNARYPERATHPVNCIDRVQARAYCAWRGRRLPTETEWDYAARGGDGRLYPWGNRRPVSCDDAVVSGLCSRQPEPTRPVGTRTESARGPFGLADMSGNVWEWVESAGTGVLRGGGWDYPPERATVVARLEAPESRADVSYGFRCALSLSPPATEAR